MILRAGCLEEHWEQINGDKRRRFLNTRSTDKNMILNYLLLRASQKYILTQTCFCFLGLDHAYKYCVQNWVILICFWLYSIGFRKYRQSCILDMLTGDLSILRGFIFKWCLACFWRLLTSRECTLTPTLEYYVLYNLSKLTICPLSLTITKVTIYKSLLLTHENININRFISIRYITIRK